MCSFLFSTVIHSWISNQICPTRFISKLQGAVDEFGNSPIPFSMNEVKLVVSKTGCTEQSAVNALKRSDGQVMDALLMISSAQRERIEQQNSLQSLSSNDDDEFFSQLSKAAASFSESDSANLTRPLGLDGTLERRDERKRKKAEEQRFDAFKSEPDTPWLPNGMLKKGFSGGDVDDEPWFVG